MAKLPSIKDLPLGTLHGAAQDNVELALARGIREIESHLGQAVHTLDIHKFVAAANERHSFVPEARVDDLAVNVEQAYGYVTARTPLSISRAAYRSYQAEGFKDTVVDTLKDAASALTGGGLKLGKT